MQERPARYHLELRWLCRHIRRNSIDHERQTHFERRRKPSSNLARVLAVRLGSYIEYLVLNSRDLEDRGKPSVSSIAVRPRSSKESSESKYDAGLNSPNLAVIVKVWVSIWPVTAPCAGTTLALSSPSPTVAATGLSTGAAPLVGMKLPGRLSFPDVHHLCQDPTKPLPRSFQTA